MRRDSIITHYALRITHYCVSLHRETAAGPLVACRLRVRQEESPGNKEHHIF